MGTGREKSKILMNGPHSCLSVSGSPLLTLVSTPAAGAGKASLPERGCRVEETRGETPSFPYSQVPFTVQVF